MLQVRRGILAHEQRFAEVTHWLIWFGIFRRGWPFAAKIKPPSAFGRMQTGKDAVEGGVLENQLRSELEDSRLES
jgi:hypothetical protein